MGFVWGHPPSAGPAPTRWSFGGGWGTGSKWRRAAAGQRTGPAHQQQSWPLGDRGSAPRAVPSVPGGTVSPAGRTTKTLHPESRQAGLCPGSPSASSLRGRGSFYVLFQREPDVFGPRLASGTRAPEQVPASIRKRGCLGLDVTPRRKGHVTKSQDVWTSQGQCPEPYTPSRDTLPRTGVGHPVVPPHSPCPSSAPPARKEGSSSGLLGLLPTRAHSRLSWGWETALGTGTLPGCRGDAQERDKGDTIPDAQGWQELGGHLCPKHRRESPA